MSLVAILAVRQDGRASPLKEGRRLGLVVDETASRSIVTPNYFTGRRVSVLGGTSGMGAAVAERFARLGADVFAAGLRSTETAGFAGHDLHCGGAGHHVSARLGRIHCRTGQPGRPWSTRSGIIRRGDEYTPAVFAADPPSSRGFGWSGKWAACELSVYGHPLPLAQSVDSRPENRVHGVPRR